jgi:hypothetical protein
MLCHNGHCHCDGLLVSYEDLQRRAGGEEGGGNHLKLDWPMGTEIKLLGTKNQSLSWRCDQFYNIENGECDLPLSRLTQLVLHLTSISIRIEVSDPLMRLAKTQKLTLIIPMSLDLGTSLDWELTSDEYQSLTLQGELTLPDGLFDQILWHESLIMEDPIDQIITEEVMNLSMKIQENFLSYLFPIPLILVQ